MKLVASTTRPSNVCCASNIFPHHHHPITPLPAACAPPRHSTTTTSSSTSSGSSQPQSRGSSVVTRIYKSVNSELADVTREVWDDEEDVQAAAAKLGFDRDNLAADSRPLISDVNEWYVEQKKGPTEGYLGQLELRYIPGKGYGLVATQDIAQVEFRNLWFGWLALNNTPHPFTRQQQ